MYGDKELVNYAGSEIEARPARPMTIRERLKREQDLMNRRLVEVGEALTLLDRNPDFEKLQDLINR